MGDPVGKPRMTQRDRWKKRPIVLRYRDYCDRIREAAPSRLRTVDTYAIRIVAYIALPPSWSDKDQQMYAGKLHRQRPDFDNICKAVCDALFEEDSIIGDGRCQKLWCFEGQQRTEIKVLFQP